MISIAFFVEGQTEQVFIEKLLRQILGRDNYYIERIVIRGKGERRFLKLKASKNNYFKYYFQIIDVGTDEKVVSDIKENMTNMINNHNYKKIFGIRDVYPIPRKEKSNLEKVIKAQLNNKQVTVIFATMEIEAWFLADPNLFENLFPESKPSLTSKYIKEKISYKGKPVDLIKSDPEKIFDHPTNIVKDIFELANEKYKKREADSYKISKNINYDTLYFDTKEQGKISVFHDFIDQFEKVIT